MLLIILLKFRNVFLIRSNLHELRNRRHGLMLFNKISFIDFVFLKRSQNKYTFKIFGTTQLKLRDSNEIKEGFIQIMPLEVNLPC